MTHSQTAVPILCEANIELIYDLVASQRFGVEYQPIVDVRSGDIMAFEALARFYKASGEMICPERVFDALHDDRELLASVELELKKLQLDYAPDYYDLFLNIDPHAVNCSSVKEPCELMSLILGSSKSVVVELIENSDIHEAMASVSIHKMLQQRGIKTALDDIGADHALLSLEILSLVDHLKLDRSWAQKIKENRYEKLLRTLLAFASVMDKKTVIEGIEDRDMLEVASEYRISAAQGFLYRDLFRQVSP